MDASRQPSLLMVEDLQTHFAARVGLAGKKRRVRALDGVTFSIGQSETLGVVGESGCGKTTLARTVVGLYRPTGGAIRYHASIRIPDRRDPTPAPGRIQMIFQDPYASFNPRWTAKAILTEPLLAARSKANRLPVEDAIEAVGLGVEALSRYPHEFSGGQRQRLAVARAIVTRPALVVADEVVSALDCSIQAQILNLLLDMKRRYGVSYLFISHDISVVQHVSDRVMVLYAGQIVEIGPAQTLMNNPRHPYTQALLAARPSGHIEGRAEPPLGRSEPPSPLAYPPGCRFHPRCPLVQERCRHEIPKPRVVGPAQEAACHLL